MNRQQRKSADNAKVLTALNEGLRYVYPIWKSTGLRLGRIYAALIRLEVNGDIVSGWDPGPYPRRRWYQLNRPT